MKIAIPLAAGRLCLHFGHCEAFYLAEVDPLAGSIIASRLATPPAHAPGVLPEWLAGEGVNVVIAGGMGARAQQLFAHAGIEVVTGAAPERPEALVQGYLGGTLLTGENVCDH